MLTSQSLAWLFIPLSWLVILKWQLKSKWIFILCLYRSENLIKYLIIKAAPSKRVNTLEDVRMRLSSGNHLHCCLSMRLNYIFIYFWNLGEIIHFLVQECYFLLVVHYYINDISKSHTLCHPAKQPVKIYRMLNMCQALCWSQ